MSSNDGYEDAREASNALRASNKAGNAYELNRQYQMEIDRIESDQSLSDREKSHKKSKVRSAHTKRSEAMAARDGVLPFLAKCENMLLNRIKGTDPKKSKTKLGALLGTSPPSKTASKWHVVPLKVEMVYRARKMHLLQELGDTEERNERIKEQCDWLDSNGKELPLFAVLNDPVKVARRYNLLKSDGRANAPLQAESWEKWDKEAGPFVWYSETWRDFMNNTALKDPTPWFNHQEVREMMENESSSAYALLNMVVDGLKTLVKLEIELDKAGKIWSAQTKSIRNSETLSSGGDAASKSSASYRFPVLSIGSLCDRDNQEFERKRKTQNKHVSGCDLEESNMDASAYPPKLYAEAVHDFHLIQGLDKHGGGSKSAKLGLFGWAESAINEVIVYLENTEALVYDHGCLGYSTETPTFRADEDTRSYATDAYAKWRNAYLYGGKTGSGVKAATFHISHDPFKKMLSLHGEVVGEMKPFAAVMFSEQGHLNINFRVLHEFYPEIFLNVQKCLAIATTRARSLYSADNAAPHKSRRVETLNHPVHVRYDPFGSQLSANAAHNAPIRRVLPRPRGDLVSHAAAYPNDGYFLCTEFKFNGKWYPYAKNNFFTPFPECAPFVKDASGAIRAPTGKWNPEDDELTEDCGYEALPDVAPEVSRAPWRAPMGENMVENMAGNMAENMAEDVEESEDSVNAATFVRARLPRMF